MHKNNALQPSHTAGIDFIEILFFHFDAAVARLVIDDIALNPLVNT